MSARETIDRWVREAGFTTMRALADCAGLADYELSRIVNGHRRPTGLQLRKIASALKKSPAELMALLLPDGELEKVAVEDVIEERDELVAELGAVREHLVETTARLEEARAQIENLGAELSRLQLRNDQLEEDLDQHRARATAASARSRSLMGEKAKLEAENRKLQRMVDESQNTLEAVKREAARDLAKVYEELRGERAAGIQRQILTGTLGAAVGAIIRGAAANRRSRRDDDDFDDDDFDDDDFDDDDDFEDVYDDDDEE